MERIRKILSLYCSLVLNEWKGYMFTSQVDCQQMGKWLVVCSSESLFMEWVVDWCSLSYLFLLRNGNVLTWISPNSAFDAHVFRYETGCQHFDIFRHQKGFRRFICNLWVLRLRNSRERLYVGCILCLASLVIHANHWFGPLVGIPCAKDLRVWILTPVLAINNRKGWLIWWWQTLVNGIFLAETKPIICVCSC